MAKKTKEPIIIPPNRDVNNPTLEAELTHKNGLFGGFFNYSTPQEVGNFNVEQANKALPKNQQLPYFQGKLMHNQATTNSFLNSVAGLPLASMNNASQRQQTNDNLRQELQKTLLTNGFKKQQDLIDGEEQAQVTKWLSDQTNKHGQDFNKFDWSNVPKVGSKAMEHLQQYQQLLSNDGLKKATLENTQTYQKASLEIAKENAKGRAEERKGLQEYRNTQGQIARTNQAIEVFKVKQDYSKDGRYNPSTIKKGNPMAGLPENIKNIVQNRNNGIITDSDAINALKKIKGDVAAKETEAIIKSIPKPAKASKKQTKAIEFLKQTGARKVTTPSGKTIIIPGNR